MTAPFTVSPSVNPKAFFAKASRIFNGTDWDMELLQNALRAGATAINLMDVRLDEHYRLFIIEDNGSGISAEGWHKLLAFGDSGWEHDIVAGQAAGGMGVFAALLAHPTHVMSKGVGVNFTPDALADMQDVTVGPVTLPEWAAPYAKHLRDDMVTRVIVKYRALYSSGTIVGNFANCVCGLGYEYIRRMAYMSTNVRGYEDIRRMAYMSTNVRGDEVRLFIGGQPMGVTLRDVADAIAKSQRISTPGTKSKLKVPENNIWFPRHPDCKAEVDTIHTIVWKDATLQLRLSGTDRVGLGCFVLLGHPVPIGDTGRGDECHPLQKGIRQLRLELDIVQLAGDEPALTLSLPTRKGIGRDRKFTELLDHLDAYFKGLGYYGKVATHPDYVVDLADIPKHSDAILEDFNLEKGCYRARREDDVLLSFTDAKSLNLALYAFRSGQLSGRPVVMPDDLGVNPVNWTQLDFRAPWSKFLGGEVETEVLYEVESAEFDNGFHGTDGSDDKTTRVTLIPLKVGDKIGNIGGKDIVIMEGHTYVAPNGEDIEYSRQEDGDRKQHVDGKLQYLTYIAKDEDFDAEALAWLAHAAGAVAVSSDYGDDKDAVACIECALRKAHAAFRSTSFVECKVSTTQINIRTFTDDVCDDLENRLDLKRALAEIGVKGDTASASLADRPCQVVLGGIDGTFRVVHVKSLLWPITAGRTVLAYVNVTGSDAKVITAEEGSKILNV